VKAQILFYVTYIERFSDILYFEIKHYTPFCVATIIALSDLSIYLVIVLFLSLTVLLKGQNITLLCVVMFSFVGKWTCNVTYNM
jgi:uncharacterized membrane protein YesL